MIFSTIQFLLFFSLFLIGFFTTPIKYRNIALFIGSILFIYIISPVFLITIVPLIGINYLLGIKIEKPSTYKKLFFYSGITVNALSLLFYKYINFIFENINLITHNFSNNTLPHLDIIAPIGISFYTLQAIGYLYVLYKGFDKPERNIIDFSLYFIYFPKLTSGPIERHEKFLPQLKKRLEFIPENIEIGGRLFLWGLFKKIVIANSLGLVVVEINGNIEKFSGAVYLLTFLIQPIYLYCDFSGYTDMALGISKMLNINLTNNFNRPFFAKSITQFWKRFHISLSSWCNDFIYKPLMIKHIKWGNYAASYAVIVTFLFFGVWHGANWNYFVIGILQAVAINYEFFTKRIRHNLFQKIHPEIGNWISYIAVYLFYSVTLLFFFSHSLNDAFYFIKSLFNELNCTNTGLDINLLEFSIAIIGAIIVISIDYINEKGFSTLNWFNQQPRALKWSVYIFSLTLIYFLSKNQSNYVYMQF